MNVLGFLGFMAHVMCWFALALFMVVVASFALFFHVLIATYELCKGAACNLVKSTRGEIKCLNG